MSIFLYLAIGTLIALALDILASFNDNVKPMNINMVDRLVYITLWPIATLIFIYHFIRALITPNDD